MSETKSDWTTEDLERYHDGELDAARRTELCEALRRDRDLCVRLATIRRVDDRLRTAFFHPQQNQPRKPLRLSRAPYPAIAACLLFAMSVTGWLAWDRPPSKPDAPGGNVLAIRQDDAGTTNEPEYKAIRIVLSLRTETSREDATTKRALNVTQPVMAAKPDADTLDRFLARLDHEIAAGRIKQSLDLLRGVSDKRRTIAYHRMSTRLRSAMEAEQILDQLNPNEQLFVCSLWVRVPIAQPTVFERLRHFSAQPELSGEVRLIVAELARDPHLRPWFYGYQLVAGSNTRPNVQG